MNKEKDEFYVGYLNQDLPETKSFLKSRLFLILGLIALVSAIFAFGQNKFKNSSFELSKLTEISGVFHEKPYPMLKVKDVDGAYKSVLLLGFGKFGAAGGLAEISPEMNLESKILSLKGTLIYYDGKTFLQLENNLTNTFKVGDSELDIQTQNSLGSITIKGEVVDPKCYFGVMKPGKGKIHRSCAVRCLSGGIPPVFVTTNSKGESNYFLITDRSGNKIDNTILTYVGKPIEISGKLEQIDDWIVLRVDVEKDIRTLESYSSIYSNQ
jgi:hypothetical protein